MRYHLLRRGRIVASGADPDALAQAVGQPNQYTGRNGVVVSDEDWWGGEWRRALRLAEPLSLVAVTKEPTRPVRRKRIRWAERYRGYWIAKAERRRALRAWEQRSA